MGPIYVIQHISLKKIGPEPRTQIFKSSTQISSLNSIFVQNSDRHPKDSENGPPPFGAQIVIWVVQKGFISKQIDNLYATFARNVDTISMKMAPYTTFYIIWYNI